MSFLGGASGKEPTFRCRRRKRCGFDPLIPVGQEDFLAEGMATHSSTLAWRIPWAEEPGGLSPGGRKESDRLGDEHTLT